MTYYDKVRQVARTSAARFWDNPALREGLFTLDELKQAHQAVLRGDYRFKHLKLLWLADFSFFFSAMSESFTGKAFPDSDMVIKAQAEIDKIRAEYFQAKKKLDAKYPYVDWLLSIHWKKVGTVDDDDIYLLGFEQGSDSAVVSLNQPDPFKACELYELLKFSQEKISIPEKLKRPDKNYLKTEKESIR